MYVVAGSKYCVGCRTTSDKGLVESEAWQSTGQKKNITKKWYKQPTRAFPMEYKNIYLSLCNCSRYYVKTLP
jgi:hypothetical protein